MYLLLVILGDLRNDLYLTLTRGDFEKGAKTAAKNIEVRVAMFDSEGNIIRVSRYHIVPPPSLLSGNVFEKEKLLQMV